MHLKMKRIIGRGEWIRTTGLLVPNQALYQAEPRPVDSNLSIAPLPAWAPPPHPCGLIGGERSVPRMNTNSKQDQKKNRRQETRQGQGSTKQGKNPSRLHDNPKLYDHERAETRMTR